MTKLVEIMTNNCIETLDVKLGEVINQNCVDTFQQITISQWKKQ